MDTCGQLFVGGIQAALDVGFLQAAHICCIVKATGMHATVQYPAEYHGATLELPVSFGMVALNLVDQVLDTVHAMLLGGGNVYIHCGSGRHRSCAAVAMYLVKHQGFSAAEAMVHVSKCRKQAEFNYEWVKGRRPLAPRVEDAERLWVASDTDQ